MSFKQGDRVRHPLKAEWGLGEVLADVTGKKVRVFFVGAGAKTLSLTYVTLECVPPDEAAHPLLDNLHAPAEGGRIRYQSLPASIERFLALFPHGFYGDRFAKEEREYKVQAHQLAQQILSKSELARVLTAHEYDEVCRRALRVANKTNLIFPNEKMALKDGLKPPANQQAFATALVQLLYGDDDLQPRFERYAAMLEGIGAAKWTIATYFLFIVSPETYMFLKPTVTQNAAEVSGFAIHYRPELNWRTYASVLTFAQYLMTKLTELAPRDMIDVQSFMWCIAPGKC